MVNVNSSIIERKSLIFFAAMLAIAYLYGILSPQHYSPSVLDLYISLGVTLALCVGLLVYTTQINIKYINYTGILCFFFAIVIILQPLLSNIDYKDSLIFPFSSLILMGCLSIVITNTNNRTIVITMIMAGLYTGGIITVCTQLLQLLSLPYPAWLNQLLFYGTDNSRPYGNVGQPNQAAYIIAMAIVASGYWFIKFKDQARLPIVLLITILVSSVMFLAIGQGLSSSRGGLVLSITACLGVITLNKTSIKKRLSFSGLLLTIFVLGNWLGSKLLVSYSSFQLTALDRVVSTDTSRPLRWYLQEQAWLTFSTDWLTGAGWANLPKVALTNAEVLNRFVFATNTHFLPSQIAAELGLIGICGLLGLAFIVLKGFARVNYNFENKTLATLIIISLLYASSEYPFWYVRFLFLFVCLIALIDNKKIEIKFNIKPIFIFIFTVIIVGSGYYMKSYRQYVAVDSLIKYPDIEDSQAQNLVAHLSNVYGFSKFKEVMLFKVLLVESNNIEPSIELGNRVVSNYLDPDLIEKQAILLALDNQKQESLKLYKAACLYDFSIYCENVENNLHQLSNSPAGIFVEIYDDFRQWRLYIK